MRKKDVMIIGAGKIGRGYLSDLFSECGFHLVLVNNRTETIDALNKAGSYTIFISEKSGLRKKIISGYEAYAVSRDFDQITERLTQIDLACIALYPSAYESVAKVIAAAVIKRKELALDEPLNFCMFVNYVGSGKLMKESVLSLLDESQKDYFKNHIGIVEALTWRGGIQPTEEMLAEDPLCVSTNEGKVMPVGDEFVGGRPTEVPYFEFIDKAEGRLVLKVWCGNMRHCTIANIGQHRGYTFTYECARDPYIRHVCDMASNEALTAVQKEFDFTDEDIAASNKNNWEDMASGKDHDYVTRVAADPLRKLSRNERYIGPALLCLKNDILPYYLAKGAAYELLFHNDKDVTANKMHQMISDLGIEEALWQFTGLNKDVRDEYFLYQLILKSYKDICNS